MDVANQSVNLQCFDIPAFNSNNGETLSFVIDIHPALQKLVNCVIDTNKFGFRNRDQVIRWCILWGLYSLLEDFPGSPALARAREYVLHLEVFERQQECLTDSIQKSLSAGNVEAARRLVQNCFEEYNRIPVSFWRDLWLSTLMSPIEMLRRHGVIFSWTPTLRIPGELL